MIVRVFSCRAHPGKAEELGRLLREVSLPFLDSQEGLAARFAGGPYGDNRDEFVIISVWPDMASLQGMTGPDWERPVIPDAREAELMAAQTVRHFESFG